MYCKDYHCLPLGNLFPKMLHIRGYTHIMLVRSNNEFWKIMHIFFTFLLITSVAAIYKYLVDLVDCQTVEWLQNDCI